MRTYCLSTVITAEKESSFEVTDLALFSTCFLKQNGGIPADGS
jgi:hypothetical protein